MLDISPVLGSFFSKPLWLSLIVSLAMIPILKLPAKKLGLVDHPGGRKQHTIIAALVGGPAIIIAFYASMFAFTPAEEANGMLVAVGCLFIIGLIDDKFDISAVVRLILQTAIIGTALWYDNIWLYEIPFTSNFSLQLSYAAYPITIIVMLALKNAINMLDGLDGLTSGVSLITLGFLIGIATISNNEHVLIISTALFGGLLGFWAFNYRFSWRNKASIFLGDSGSMVLGFLLPYIAIKLSLDSSALTSPALLIWLVAIPIWDIITVVIKRIRMKKSPMKAGRDHIHHTLMNAGLEVRQVLHLVYLLSIAAASLGLVMVYLGFSATESYFLYVIGLGLYIQRINSLDRRNNVTIP